MSDAPFFQKRLAVEIIVPKGIKKMNYHTGSLEDSENSGQRISLTKYRINAGIECYGQTSAVAATIDIYNLPLALMRALSGYGTLGVFSYGTKSAGDIAEGAGVVEVALYVSPDTNDTLANASSDDKVAQAQSMVFKGSLINATANMSAVPDPFLTIQCNTLNKARILPADVISFRGAVDARQIARLIADRLGLTFEDAGVTTVLQNPYFTGSAARQLEKLSQQGLFHYVVEHGTLAIWPYGGARSEAGSGITISSRNGLVGYPQFNGVGVGFRMIYNPALRFGDRITIDSAAPNISGAYNIYALSHHLSSDLPGGEWYTDVMASFLHAPLGQAFGS